MCFDGEPDLKDRDPYGVSGHIRVKFQDVIGEPPQYHSCDCIWMGSECCYEFCFTVWYGLPTWCCHLFITMFWGMEFGCLIFWHVWLASPFLHCSHYLFHVPGKCLKLCCRCFLDPWCESASYIFMFCEDPSEKFDPRRIF